MVYYNIWGVSNIRGGGDGFDCTFDAAGEGLSRQQIRQGADAGSSFGGLGSRRLYWGLYNIEFICIYIYTQYHIGL